MLEPLLFIGVGIISGISSSVPIGPTNLWIAKAVIPPSKPKRCIAAFVFSILFFDLLYAVIAFKGYSVFLQGSQLEKILGLGVSLILVAFGIVEILTLRKKAGNAISDEVAAQSSDSGSKQEERHSVLKCLGAGLVFGSNPAFIAFWITLANFLSDKHPDVLLGLPAYYVYLGIIIGDVIWYSGLVYLVGKGLAYISQQWLNHIRYAIAIGFVVFGGSYFFRSLTN